MIIKHLGRGTSYQLKDRLTVKSDGIEDYDKLYINVKEGTICKFLANSDYIAKAQVNHTPWKEGDLVWTYEGEDGQIWARLEEDIRERFEQSF